MSRIPPPTHENGPFYGTELDVAIDAFSAAAVRASAVDWLTTEVVRLRCAGYHDCRLCGSLRIGPALDEGLDEAMVAKIARYEDSDLEERHKVALRLCDAMIVDPAGADEPLGRQVREHFTDEQIAELTCDIMKWSFQKVLVALRIEPALREDELSLMTFDEQGNPILGDALPA